MARASKLSLGNNNLIRLSHILSAIKKEISPTDDLIQQILRGDGIQIPNFKVYVFLADIYTTPAADLKPMLTPAAHNSISLAIERARKLGSNNLSPYHLLVGIGIYARQFYEREKERGVNRKIIHPII